MKVWQRYKEYLLNGEWHIHTCYTDGVNSVAEYCEKALELSIPLLAFTEHVARKLSYNFDGLLAEIDKARAEYDLIILSGCEAKVLPDGSLNVSDDIIKEVDYPIFAFHSFPKDLDLFIDCLKSAIANRYVNTWAHPGLFLTKIAANIDLDTLREIFRIMKQHDVILENNSKYSLPPSEWSRLADEIGLTMVKGSDITSIDDFCHLSKSI